jgi:hydroxypyruvate isomerase
MPAFSANLGFLFQEHPLLDRFAVAARAGFTAVELADPYEQAAAIAERLEAHRLSCVLVNLPMGDKARGDKGIACLPDRIADFRDGVVQAADTARALRCPRVNCMAGIAPAGADPALLRTTFLDNVRFAARELHKAGVAVCLEALNTLERPGFFLHRSRQAEELLRALAGDEVTFQLDLYHMQLMGEDLPEVITRMAPLLGHVQFADVPGRHEPGTGTLPLPALFAQLDQVGYRGWVGAEYLPSRRTEETLAWMGRETTSAV